MHMSWQPCVKGRRKYYDNIETWTRWFFFLKVYYIVKLEPKQFIGLPVSRRPEQYLFWSYLSLCQRCFVSFFLAFSRKLRTALHHLTFTDYCGGVTLGVDRYVFFRTDTDYYRSSRPITDILNRYTCLV